ncbi:hypothetical protein MLD38_015968 [Melastoma candidum]|uniref:Uncharacterized protein n=1 Tax=Melastoma candidum TaxID=119954 RepID=A0ACB9RJ78_9MYRT|nr:hypothetical protein MLD38_015968 [Melastoma candidum]
MQLLEAVFLVRETLRGREMPAGHGLRSRTRDLFVRPFRMKGYIPLSTYLHTYKVNGAIHKGMPHKFYHGHTGSVWNVANGAIGVEINKRVWGENDI